MNKVINYKTYYAHRRTGRPANKDYVESKNFETVGDMIRRIHRETLREQKRVRDLETQLREMTKKNHYWTPKKTNNAILLNSVIWSVVILLAVLNLAIK